MEGLVTLLAELLVPLAAAAAGVVWGAGAAIVALIIDLAVGRRRKDRRWPKLVAWIGGVAAALALVIMAAAFVLNSYYFAPTMRFIADRVGEKTGARITYGTVAGSLLDGRLVFTNFQAVRSGHEKQDFSFKVDRALIDLDLWTLLPIVTPTFDIVHLENVRGRLTERRASGEAEGRKGAYGGRPDFAVNDLRIANLSVNVQKADGRELTFDMPRIEARPLRSRYALFDVMFRSTVRGSVNKHPVVITTRPQPEGRMTEWDLDRMPLSIVAAFVSRAPFTWFRSGVVDIEVRDDWQVGSVTDIHMDWRFTFENVQIVVPSGVGLRERALATATRKYFESRGERVNIAFQVDLDRERFHAVASGDAALFFVAAVEAMAAAMADDLDIDKDEIKEDLKSAADKARDYLNRRRRKEDR